MVINFSFQDDLFLKLNILNVRGKMNIEICWIELEKKKKKKILYIKKR